MSGRTNESLLDHSTSPINLDDYDIIEMPGCAPPVLAKKIKPRRKPVWQIVALGILLFGLAAGAGVWAGLERPFPCAS